MRIDSTEGIGPAMAEKLRAAGVATTEELLERAATPKGRQGLVDSPGRPRSAPVAA
ncbi:MAG: DUF4332 domain-containing protein [Streptosporangiaceae bacterium]